MATIAVRSDIEQALDLGRPVVALETTLIAHGLPRPQNLEVAHRVEQIVREEGALAATIAVVDGRPTVGLSDEQLQRIATDDDVAKLSVRDLPMCAAEGRTGATTVASTAHLAAQVGIEVFATGGLGGVHREARETWDESADLAVLASTPVLVVCSGVKSILDVAATLQRLETLGVPVVGYGTRDFPGFYLTGTGNPLDWSVQDPAGAARAFRARVDVGLQGRGMVLAQPIASSEQLDPQIHDAALRSGLDLLAARGVSGTAVTPFLLAHFHEATAGRSLAVNIRIIEHNARLAARIATALAT